MADKPAAKPEDDAYGDEEAAKRTDAAIRAMIGMKPKPRRASKPAGRVHGTERKSRKLQSKRPS